MSICPNCLSENTFYDKGEYVCLDCDFVWNEGEYPEYEDRIEEDTVDEYQIEITFSGDDEEDD